METIAKTNAVNWFELFTADFDRALSFYNTILDCQLTYIDGPESRMGMFPHAEGAGIGGCISSIGSGKPGPGGTMVYLNVDGDLDGVLSRVEAAGGKVVKGRFAIPPHGFIGIIEDTEGNVVGLHSMS